jgi:hypothetical protein
VKALAAEFKQAIPEAFAISCSALIIDRRGRD